ncbi:hypothetical protein ACHAXS_010952 [Conticribra weissflogii]
MASKRALVEAFRERESHQRNKARRVIAAAGSLQQLSLPPRQNIYMQNPVWRERVVDWYFSVISAMNRQHQASPSGNRSHIANPFNRITVHVTTALLDNHLLSLPPELSFRYRSDRSAYQLVATTSLLIGMRLTRQDLLVESAVPKETCGSGIKRVQTHQDHLNEQVGYEDASATNDGSDEKLLVPLPSASTLLRISSAPKSISEKDVLDMVREMTGSRIFPREKLVTVLDFIRVFCSTITHVNETVNDASLGPRDAEEAYRLADISLRDLTLSGCSPSILACAVVGLALVSSDNVQHNMSSVRSIVYNAIFGDEVCPILLKAVRKIEMKLLSVSAVGPWPRNYHLANEIAHSSATHVIPSEDD